MEGEVEEEIEATKFLEGGLEWPWLWGVFFAPQSRGRSPHEAWMHESFFASIPYKVLTDIWMCGILVLPSHIDL